MRHRPASRQGTYDQQFFEGISAGVINSATCPNLPCWSAQTETQPTSHIVAMDGISELKNEVLRHAEVAGIRGGRPNLLGPN
jgi:pantothenate kinase